MQLFDLGEDSAEQNNLVSKHPEKVATLLRLLDKQVRLGRSTPGEVVANDRKIKFLPKGVTLPAKDRERQR